ncbi:hypothetical protein K9F62_11050 [Desulfovibrio sp. JY]|nr:hypothetical protein K9F62_11050 [Desulfovibrio sp. JY]
MSTNRTCNICGKPISTNAKKCSECGSWQGWRFRLWFFTQGIPTVLALYITIFVSTSPLVLNFFYKKSINIKCYSQKKQDSTIAFLVKNDGTDNVIITDVFLAGDNNKIYCTDTAIELPKEATKIFNCKTEKNNTPYNNMTTPTAKIDIITFKNTKLQKVETQECAFID